eukprot:scaffold171965_cov27-Tisochrysis_lutea.AAC.2
MQNLGSPHALVSMSGVPSPVQTGGRAWVGERELRWLQRRGWAVGVEAEARVAAPQRTALTRRLAPLASRPRSEGA